MELIRRTVVVQETHGVQLHCLQKVLPLQRDGGDVCFSRLQLPLAHWARLTTETTILLSKKWIENKH
ncbi:hypothetical protein T07_3871 [Trichinella nelsoni]|uniref:Uncharacterized protein n=1 Tax=Trichinella nelsoni TaxID=6336 RepID=A0A0V0SHN2_9BILA|nr:hypothetical protein T07_3871 [Trichinella nelsoni]